MRAEWERKKSRAFALLQKFESFHPHSSHSKSFQDEKIVIPASFQSFEGHSVSEWPWNDDKVISKWLKMTGMVRDGGDQNILHQKFSSFHPHSSHSTIIPSFINHSKLWLEAFPWNDWGHHPRLSPSFLSHSYHSKLKVSPPIILCRGWWVDWLWA